MRSIIGVNVGKIESKFHPRDASIIPSGLIPDKGPGRLAALSLCSVLIETGLRVADNLIQNARGSI